MIKNDMEFLVRNEILRQRKKGGKAGEGCWCPLCEADVTALALNHLPPRYCHEENYGFTKAQGYLEKVHAVVSRAVETVNRRPKHRPKRHGRLSAEAQVLNFAQQIGGALVGAVLAQRPSACACDHCRDDVLACALNRYPPKYGVTSSGRESYQANYEDFIRHELAQVLAETAKVVEAHPHH